MPQTVFVNARIPTGLADRLRSQATENDRSVSAELRRAIAAHVGGDGSDPRRGSITPPNLEARQCPTTF
jgi:hypothetical protein